MRNLRRKIKRGAKKMVASFVLVATVLWSSALSALLFALPAKAAVTVATQPTEMISPGQTVKASSSDIPIIKFALTQSASETLSSVTVTIVDAGSTGVLSADIASLKVFKDNGDGVFGSGDLEAGSQTTVGIGTPTTITTSVNNAIGTSPTMFFVTIATSASWSDASPADAIAVSMAQDGIVTSANSPNVTPLVGANALVADTTSPTVVSVYQVNPSAVDVKFSEGVQPTLATNTANYTFANPALNVVDVIQKDPGLFRVVADNEITAGTTTLAVSANVMDFAGNANATTTAQQIVKPVKVKISEVSAEMGSADAEFIELYNAGDNAVGITGWKIQYSADGSSWSDLATIGSVTMNPGSFYLLSTTAFDSASTVAGDVNFTASLDLAGGHIRIVDSSSNEIDKIGWGTAANPEGTAIAAHSAGQSFERKAFGESTAEDLASGGMDEAMGNSWDTNNNSFDFVIQTSPNPQNSSSTAEQPVSGGTAGPMINHMPVNFAPTGSPLEIIAQMGDPMTPIDQIVAELHYMVGDGTPDNASPADFTTVVGVHQAGGFFKFTVPQSAIDDPGTSTNGLYYYLKVVTSGGTAFMSANPAVDMASVGSGQTYATYDAQEADVAKNPFIITVGIPGTTYAISGTVTDDAQTPNPLEGVLVFIEGTGYNTTTDASGNYSVSVPDGVYNVVMVKDGYYEEWINDVFVNGSPVTVDRTMHQGIGGGMTGDATKPFVTWTAPPDGMTGLPAGDGNFKIFVGFSKDLDGSTFNTTNVVLSTDGTTQVSPSVVYDNDPSSRDPMYPSDPYLGIISVPTEGLAENTTYYLVINGNVRDTAGNALQGNRPEGGHTISFTTGLSGSNLDFNNFGTGAMMPPFVIGTTPSDGAIDVMANTKVIITFSDPMDSSTVNSTNIKLYKITFNNYVETKTEVNLSSVSLDTSGKIATLIPASNLSAGKYRVVVSGALKSAAGIWMGDPIQNQNVSTYEFYRAEFEVGSSVDSTPPTVLGSWPADGDTDIPVNPGVINIQFSEGMDPSTINSNTITLKRGTSAVTGKVEYDPMAHSAFFSPTVILATNTDYTLTISSGVADMVGNTLGSDQIITFTTAASGDSAAPSIMFANGDEYSIAITFSEPMNSAKAIDTDRYGTSVLNPANYVIKQGPAGTDFTTGGTLLDLSSAKFSYDEIGNTVIIEGLSGTTVGNDYYVDMTPANVSGTGAADLSGNAIAGGTTFQMPINSSADTKGMLGPTTAGDMMGPDMGKMGMMGAGAFPMNSMAGQTTTYFVDIPTTKSIPVGGKIVLTFPVGFDVTNAAADPYSPVNNDINDLGDGTITIASVTADPSARKVTITTGGAATMPTDFLHVDIKGIVNSSVPRGPETSGYTVDMKTLDDSGNLLETITTMPFFITEAGTSSLTVTVDGVTSGDNGNVSVFLGSPMTGPMEKVVNFTNETSDTVTFSGLQDGQYMLFTEPTITLGSSDYSGIPMPQPVDVSGASTATITLTKEAAGAGKAAITVDVNGSFGTDDIDVFAGSPTSFKVKTITNAGTNPAPVTLYLPDGDWMVGMGPAMPKGPMSGPPPMPDWMPPMPVNVRISGNGTVVKETSGTPDDGTIVFNVASATMQIIGYVQDDAGNAIAGADVFAYQPMGTEGMGANATTDTNGKFVLKVAAPGTYSVGVFKPGLPSVPDKTVKVSTEGSVSGGNADGNSTADIIVDDSLITTSNKFIFKIKKPDYTISGKVTNGTSPVAYAPVWAYQPNGTGHADTVSDAAGNYILYVDSGTWIVQASIPGYGYSEEKTVVIDGASATQDIAPDSSVTYYTISGTVTINGAPQAFMPIRAVEYDSNGNYLGKEYGGQTDSLGSYSISVPGSASGKYYRVDIWTPEFGEVELTTDEVANNPANIIVTNADRTGANITISSTNTITLAFTNGSASQSAIVDIDGVSGNPPKPTGFHKTINLSTLGASATVELPNGSYMFVMNVPGVGEFTPQGGNPVTVSGNGTVTFVLPDSSTQLFTVSGTVDDGTNPIEGAWVWMGSQTTGVHKGSLTAADGTYSITVKAGTYKMGVEMPGYMPLQPIEITVSADVANQNYSLTPASQFISGRIYYDANGNGSYDSGEEIANGWVWVEETTTKQISGAPTQVDGTFILGVGDGTYVLRGAAEGYQETKYDTPITISGADSSGNNINLQPDQNWNVKIKSKPIVPASGGTLDDSGSSGTGVKVIAPPNALGNETSSGTIKAKEVSSVSRTSSAEPLGGKGKKITAQDNSGQAITNLNDEIEVELNYYKSDITEAGIKDFNKLKSLTNSYWDASVGDWVPLSTTRKAYTKASSSDKEWTVQPDFNAFVDTLASNPDAYADYKITLRSTTSHLTIFGATTPSDLVPPAAPTGLTQTAGTGTSVTLDWADNSESDLMEYEIYRSTSSGVAAIDANQVNTSQVSVSNFTDSTTTAWTSYYYTVTAVDDSGNESQVASEIQVCSNNSVSHGTVAPDCTITCEAGYSLVGHSCVAGGNFMGGQVVQFSGSIVINNNEEQTTSRQVSLQLSSQGAVEMMISNSADFAGASWESYASSKEWTLEEGDGLKTVYAKFKNSSGAVSNVASDSIILNTSSKSKEEAPGNAPAETPAGNAGEQANPGGYSNGTLIRASGDYKVYVIKDGFKRWIMSPEIFNFYGHLSFAVVKEVSPEIANSYQEASLIRVAGDPKVYEINGDGTKHWLNMTAEEFVESGRKWEAVYIVNQKEADYYKTGPDVLFVRQ